MAKSDKIAPGKEEEITRTQWARYERARDNGHLARIIHEEVKKE